MDIEPFSTKVRERIAEEMRVKKLSHRDIAGILQWNPNKVHKLMNGRVRMTVDDLWWLAFAISVPVSELVRDRGMEFFAEMTPTELRAFQNLRASPKEYQDAIYKILHVRTSPTAERYATAVKPAIRGKAKPR